MSIDPNDPPRKRRKQQKLTFTEAAERAASAREFTAEVMKGKIDQTATDDSSPSAEGPTVQTHETTSSQLTSTSGGITHFAETSQIPLDILAPEGGVAERFELLEELGHGATGRVYALRDNVLDRTVAVKFLRHVRESARQHFLHEARVTASLEHPNIMPVYDVGVTDDGRLFFSMKRTTGTTLGDAIRRAHDGGDVPAEFLATDGKVRIFLKLCDALTFAHHHGYVHQDVKPDNIVLGEYGEVLLLDWGSAIRISRQAGDGTHLYGTPAYMSPEQARRENADERSDVYCVGATLFHALLIRHPTWAQDPQTFWAKKRRGEIDVPSPEEWRRVPRVLVNIALKAMHPEASRRYQSMLALAEDLKRYQAGLSVTAHHENVVEAFARWHRRNKRVFWISAVAASAVVGIGTLLFREKVQEMVTWRPLYAETFEGTRTADLAANWRALTAPDWNIITEESLSDSGGWLVDSGSLVGFGHGGFRNLTFRKRIPGDIRAEWDVTPVRRNLNLNCYIAGENRLGGYTFHVGGWDDPRVVVLTKGAVLQRLDNATLARGLQLNRPHRIRIEKEGQWVRFYLDGRKYIDYRDRDDFSGPGHQTFGFEVNIANELRYDNLRVYYHPLPLKVSPIATANRYFEAGQFTDALEQYQELREAYPDNDIAAVAQYKIGRCLEMLGQPDSAEKAYREFERVYPRHEMRVFCGAQRGRMLEMAGDTSGAEEIYRQLAQSNPNHAVLRTVFFDMSNARLARARAMLNGWVRDSTDTLAAPKWLEREGKRMHRLGTAFGVPLRGNMFIEVVADELIGGDYYTPDEVMAAFPEQVSPVVGALMNRGREDDVFERFEPSADGMTHVRLKLGKYEDVVKYSPESRAEVAQALVEMGHFPVVLKHFPDQRQYQARALARMGDFETLFEKFGDVTAECLPVARDLGRLREYMARCRLETSELARAYFDFVHKPDSALQVVLSIGESRTFYDNLLVTEVYREKGELQALLRITANRPDFEMAVEHALRVAGRSEQAMRMFPQVAGVVIPSLFERGEFEAIQARYPGYEADIVKVLMCAGRSEEVLRRWKQNDSLRASILLLMGEYDEVVRRYPYLRRIGAEAMLRAGKYDVVLSKYDDCREAGAAALLAQGLVEEALVKYPESRRSCAMYLLDSGRAPEVIERFADQPYPYALALAREGKHDLLATMPRWPVLPDYVEAFDVAVQHALYSWQRGERHTADSLFANLPLYRFDWCADRFSRYMLAPVLRALDGDSEPLRRACRNVADSLCYVQSRRLWYEASLLLGEVSDQQFLAQPFGHNAARRLHLMRAVQADIAGDREKAASGYREWLHPGRHVVHERMIDLEHSGAMWAFAQWRLSVNAAAEPGTRP